ncbi:MAG: inositol monophosphatase [Anaerolineae bacterium]|nr:inositol monophosphatase [Anaerolineae bacterium]
MLTEILTTAERIVRDAGAILLDYAARGQNQAHSKASGIDLVTVADGASEAAIVAAIQAAYPDHHIHGEEGGGYGPAPDTAPFRWYVDPVDGTTNYAHGYPHYCVNLSVVDAAGEPVVGVTYDPTRDECFTAEAGRGAWCNGQSIYVSGAATLFEALVASGFPYDSHTAADNNSDAWAAFVRRTQSTRRGGAAALDLAYVACGRLDGYWERIQPWDSLAGVLMVREAGGTATDYSGGPVGEGREILASNGRIHAEMRAVLASLRRA